MLKIEELKNWCWYNLDFRNVPENIDETYVSDIVAGYNGTATTVEGKKISYSEIRTMFEKESE